MFEHQIDQGKKLRDRISHYRELRNDVPDHQKATATELTAWLDATKELVAMVFGVNSTELEKYNTIYNSKQDLMDRAVASGDDRWEWTYRIDFFNLMLGLLYELEGKYRDRHSEVKTREVYNISGQLGAVGPHSTARDLNFSQIWHHCFKQLDFTILIEELAKLRKQLREEAQEPEHDIAVAAIAEAELAAKRAEGPKVLEYLARAGTWALEVGTRIRVPVAMEALKKSLGM